MGKIVKYNTKKKPDYNGIVNAIVSETLCRHSDMSSEDYLKNGLKIEDTKGVSEKEIVDTAIYNLLMETTRTAIIIKQNLDAMAGVLNLYIKDHDLEETKKLLEEGENEDGEQ